MGKCAGHKWVWLFDEPRPEDIEHSLTFNFKGYSRYTLCKACGAVGAKRKSRRGLISTLGNHCWEEKKEEAKVWNRGLAAQPSPPEAARTPREGQG